MQTFTQFTPANAARRLLALSAIAMMAVVPALAANRGQRLHAAAHPAGHVIATHSEYAHQRVHHAARSEPADERHAKHGKKAAESRAAISSSNARAKNSSRGRRETEVDDYPVVMHRASSHAHPLSKREHQQELAEAHYEATLHSRSAYVTPARERVVPLKEHGEREREVAVEREADPSTSRYASHEFAASYENASRSVDQAVRPNAFARRSDSTDIGTALRAAPASSNADERLEPARDPIADEARRSSVVVRRAVPQAQVSADSGPLPSQHYAPRVATGFGAEVAPLPQTYSRQPAGRQSLTTEAQDLGEDLAADGVPSARTLANDAMQPLVTPMYSREGNLMMPAPLRGSHEILVHQNVMADHDGLERIRDDNQLNRLRADRELVSFPESASLRVNEGLPENRRYARPWTVQFAADAARAFFQRFGEPLQVNSAVRTVSYQARLQRVNGNAAATSGEGASPHLTGQAIDLAKRGMTADEIAWMRTYLLPFIDAGKVDVEEEFQQACFHISVYRSYLPAVRRQSVQVAQFRPIAPTASVPVHEYADPDQ